MFSWIVRLVLALAGIVAGWFVAREDTNFVLFQMVAAMLLVTAGVAVAAFWPSLVRRFTRGRRTDREP